MNTEQLKTDRTKEQIIEMFLRKHGVILADEQLKDIESDALASMYDSMDSFASRESKIAVDEFKEKLRKGLFRLDMYGPDNMVKMKEFEDLIDKL